MIKTILDKLNKNEKSKDYLINQYLDNYFIKKQAYPSFNPHKILAEVWLEFHKINLQKDDLENMKIAMNETYNFSCLPEPYNAKALAVWLAYKDMPALIGYQNAYSEQIRLLLKPVYLAKKNGKISEVYKKFNHQLEMNS